MTDNIATWLDSLKAGDEVAVRNGYGPDNVRICKVDRTTPTLILVGPTKYRRKDGYVMGRQGLFSRLHIAPPTDDTKERAARARLVSRIALMSKEEWRSLPLASLEAIAAIIDKGSGE
jgi:hypothetical protein